MYVTLSLSLFIIVCDNVFLTEILVGDNFPGAPDGGVFIVDGSGEFNDSSIWRNKILPYGNASVVISSGASATITRETFDLNMVNCDVYGNLILGDSAKSAVTFVNPGSINVYQGGSVQFVSSVKQFNIPVGLILTAFPDSTVSGNNVTVVTGSSSRSLTTTTSRSFMSGGRGPKTSCGLEKGRSFDKDAVVDLPQKSGDFNSDDTWFGKKKPSPNKCKLAGGSCAISIETSVSLSTSSLGGSFDLNVNAISVSVLSIIEIGTKGFSGGFKFKFSMVFEIFGTMEEVSETDGGIWVVVNTQINFRAGAKFRCKVDTSLIVYNPVTGAIISRVRLSASFTGPLFFAIDASGSISISILGMILNLLIFKIS
jgi:hypothetical protein